MVEQFERHPDADIEHQGETQESPEYSQEELDDIDREVDRLTKEIHDAAAKEDAVALAKAQEALRGVLASEIAEHKASSTGAERHTALEEKLVPEPVEIPEKSTERKESKSSISSNLAEDLFVKRMQLAGTRKKSSEVVADPAQLEKWTTEHAKLQEEFAAYDEGESVKDMAFMEKIVNQEMKTLMKKIQLEQDAGANEEDVQNLREELVRWRDVKDNIEDGVNPPWTAEIGAQEFDEYADAPTEVIKEEKAA